MIITSNNTEEINFSKGGGLVAAIVQDATSGRVLMLGYMNEAALKKTLEKELVTFYSRSKERLWTKGETSGNHLALDSIYLDCDQDALLVLAHPKGPTCHTGQTTCFGEEYTGLSFLSQLEKVVSDRHDNPSEQSYTSSLFRAGLDKIIQKVGEEAIEVVIEAKNENKELLLGELADLTFHLLVLLKAKRINLKEVVSVLMTRHSKT